MNMEDNVSPDAPPGPHPIIDISAFGRNNAGEQSAVSNQLINACKSNGFFYLVGHGVSEELLGKVYDHSRTFHYQPRDLKDLVHVRHSWGNRGWAPTTEDETDTDPELYRLVEIKASLKDPLTKPRMYSHFGMALELPASDPDHMAGNVLLGPNQWPEIPNFRRDVSGYYDELMQLCRILFKAFARGLKLPDNYFDPFIKKPTSELRLIHYPRRETCANSGGLGIEEHSDFECFTILSASSPGLQILSANNRWIDAPPLPGAFAVNIGDMLEAWTNGEFKSTQHRVIDTGSERFSIPFFCAADYDTEVYPLPQFVSPENPAKYRKFIAGEHLAGFVINDTKHLRRRVKLGHIKVDFAIVDENPFKRDAN